MCRKVQRERKRGENLEDIETQRTLHYCLCFAMRWKHRLVHVSVSMHINIENEQSAREDEGDRASEHKQAHESDSSLCLQRSRWRITIKYRNFCSFLEVLGFHFRLPIFFFASFFFKLRGAPVSTVLGGQVGRAQNRRAKGGRR
jgi:hypothetical protein